MKTHEENNNSVFASPGVKVNDNTPDNAGNAGIEEYGQQDTHESVENEDADNWYNESAI
jgi:hypothetical protein